MVYLTGSEEGLEKFDGRAHKGNIGQPEVARGSGAGVHTGALDVHAYEIGFGETASQSNGIFAFATAQFEHYRPVVAEEIAVPTASQRECRAVGHIGRCHGVTAASVLVRPLGDKTSVGILEDKGDSLHLGKLAQLIFSHI